MWPFVFPCYLFFLVSQLAASEMGKSWIFREGILGLQIVRAKVWGKVLGVLREPTNSGSRCPPNSLKGISPWLCTKCFPFCLHRESCCSKWPVLKAYCSWNESGSGFVGLSQLLDCVRTFKILPMSCKPLTAGYGRPFTAWYIAKSQKWAEIQRGIHVLVCTRTSCLNSTGFIDFYASNTAMLSLKHQVITCWSEHESESQGFHLLFPFLQFT